MKFKVRVLSIALLVVFTCGMVFASTAEVSQKINFWTEFDITFWQTLPFATFWGYVVASQLSPGVVNWSPVMNFALAVSVGNAIIHARRAVNVVK
jgi:hypothetical protein